MSCPCTERHDERRIVLTGGPGGGKTAVLELVRHTFCSHVTVLPESAGIVFGGGFPRGEPRSVRCAGQRAIFYVQRELEAAHEGSNAAVVLCDRGTVDGAAYWPGPEDLWSSLGTTLEEQIARYAAVIHLRVPPAENGYNRMNPLRIETAAEAAAIDARIADAWRSHPRVVLIDPTPQFLTKASRVLHALRDLMPPCCRPFVRPLEANGATAAATR